MRKQVWIFICYTIKPTNPIQLYQTRRAEFCHSSPIGWRSMIHIHLISKIGGAPLQKYQKICLPSSKGGDWCTSILQVGDHYSSSSSIALLPYSICKKVNNWGFNISRLSEPWSTLSLWKLGSNLSMVARKLSLIDSKATHICRGSECVCVLEMHKGRGHYRGRSKATHQSDTCVRKTRI